MRNRIFLILWTTVIELLICYSVVSAQEKDEIYQVNITHDTSGWHISPCPLPGILGDTWRFTNSTSDTIYLAIPICVGKENTHFYTLAPGDTVDHLVGGMDWGVWVRVLPHGLVARCGREYPPTCPTLTQWGTIVLVALLVGSTVFVMLRRREAGIPA